MGSVLRLIGYGLAALAVIALLSTWQHRSAQLAAANTAGARCVALYDELGSIAEKQNAALADSRRRVAEQQRIIDALRMQVELQAQH